jgi:hypothetical protein
MTLTEMRRDWIDRNLPQLISKAKQLGRFTSDDLHGSVEDPPHRNWWGVALAKLSCQKLIRRVGSRKSIRPEANGRWISEWEAA